MVKVKITRARNMQDRWRVSGGRPNFKSVTTMDYEEAKRIAAARRRLAKKKGYKV